jgi:hypothetical protein
MFIVVLICIDMHKICISVKSKNPANIYTN